MSQLLLNGRLAGNRAVKFSSLLSSVPLRQYAAPSSVQKQATAAAAAAAADGSCPMLGKKVKSIDEMPGPRIFPFAGSFPSMVMDKDFKRNKLHVYWRKLRDQYGDVVRLNLPGRGEMVLAYHPDDCQKLSRITMNNPIRDLNHTLIKVRKETIDNYFDNKPGILASNHDEWWRVRSRVQTPMMKPKNVTSYLSQMDQVALEFLDRIAEFQKELGEMPSDFQTELYKWALESVCLVALNRRLGCLSPNLSSDSEPMVLIREANNLFEGLNVTDIGPQLWRFFPTPAYNRVKKSHDTFLRIADENIRQTEAQLLAKDPNSEEELTLMETLLMTEGLTRTDVVTLILDMMFAGIDTTANTIGFTLYLLARNQKVQKKLQEEIDTVIGDYQGPLTPKHLGQLSYLKAVVKESLRLFPLAGANLRTIEEDSVLGGYLLPKGISVISMNMFMSDDEQFFPKPREFIPERWSRDRPLGDIHPFASQPFGLGTRMCIGRRIAEQELYTLLTRLMQRFSVDYKYQDMDIHTRLINVPSEPLRFNFTERKQ